MSNKKRKKIKKRKSAKESIYLLFENAEKTCSKNPKLADDYVRKARNIAMKVNLRMPKELKRRFCKHCYSYFIPGNNYRIRIKNKVLVCYCKNCKKFMRFPFFKSNQ